MAKKTTGKKQPASPFDYGAELRRLRELGPERLYLLEGEEDYLRDRFLRELRASCVQEGTEAFNLHRMDGAALDVARLREIVEAMPFMGEGTLTEVRGFDINRVSGYDGKAFKTLVEDIPSWATVALIFAPDYTPDGRLAAVKAARASGRDIRFDKPTDAELVQWVRREMKTQGKAIGPAAARHLIEVCGVRMYTLLQEITKLAGLAAGDEVAISEIDAVVTPAPETTIFNLTDSLSGGRYDEAARLLSDLLSDPNESPQGIIFMIGEQYRRLFVARVAMDEGKPAGYIAECLPELGQRKWLIDRLRTACRRYSLPQLRRAVTLCAECDYGMKTNGPAAETLLRELLLRLAVERT